MMAFYRMNEPGDPKAVAHINFGRKRGPLPCMAPDPDTPAERCARMSVALCDGPAGVDLAGNPLTCDAPMCSHHRTSVGPNRDLCPRCVAKRHLEAS